MENESRLVDLKSRETCLYLLNSLAPVDEGFKNMLWLPEQLYVWPGGLVFSSATDKHAGTLFRHFFDNEPLPRADELPSYGIAAMQRGSYLFCALVDQRRKVIVMDTVSSLWRSGGASWDKIKENLWMAADHAAGLAIDGKLTDFVVAEGSLLTDYNLSPATIDGRGDVFRSGKITHIFRPRSDKGISYLDFDHVVPSLWKSEIQERDRVELVESALREEMRNSPVGSVLGKCLYAIKHASSAFRDQEVVADLVCSVVEIIRDVGEPAGVSVLEAADASFGSRESVRESVSDALARIGRVQDLEKMWNLIKRDLPMPIGHLEALVVFVGRYPEIRSMVLKVLKRLNGLDDELRRIFLEEIGE